jgi:hypothetical protein
VRARRRSSLAWCFATFLQKLNSSLENVLVTY